MYGPWLPRQGPLGPRSGSSRLGLGWVTWLPNFVPGYCTWLRWLLVRVVKVNRVVEALRVAEVVRVQRPSILSNRYQNYDTIGQKYRIGNVSVLKFFT